MNVYHEHGESIFGIPDTRVQVYGGEYILDDGLDISGYGISLEDQCDEVDVSDIPPEAAVELAVLLVNHLMVNGHTFEIEEFPGRRVFKHVKPKENV